MKKLFVNDLPLTWGAILISYFSSISYNSFPLLNVFIAR